MSRDELVSFARKVRENLDLAGAFADWLEERGDPRGVLLRRRWKRWQTDREKARKLDEANEERDRQSFDSLRKLVESVGGVFAGSVHTSHYWHRADADRSFREYVGGRFPEADVLTAAELAGLAKHLAAR